MSNRLPARISRDPFARTEITRSTVLAPHRTCDWCGKRRGTTERLFSYRTESDAGRVSPHKGLYCSKPCHDAYHG